MIVVNLTKGKAALIDECDEVIVSKYKWRARKSDNNVWYAEAWTQQINGVRKLVSMHRLILNAPVGVKTDHVDGDGLNNQRYNLRLASDSQNATNKRKSSNRSSVYKGVSKKKNGKWVAQIQVWLGSFDDEVDAAKAYDNAALKYHGEFANLNFKKGDVAMGGQIYDSDVPKYPTKEQNEADTSWMLHAISCEKCGVIDTDPGSDEYTEPNSDLCCSVGFSLWQKVRSI